MCRTVAQIYSIITIITQIYQHLGHQVWSRRWLHKIRIVLDGIISTFSMVAAKVRSHHKSPSCGQNKGRTLSSSSSTRIEGHVLFYSQTILLGVLFDPALPDIGELLMTNALGLSNTLTLIIHFLYRSAGMVATKNSLIYSITFFDFLLLLVSQSLSQVSYP